MCVPSSPPHRLFLQPSPVLHIVRISDHIPPGLRRRQPFNHFHCPSTLTPFSDRYAAASDSDLWLQVTLFFSFSPENRFLYINLIFFCREFDYQQAMIHMVWPFLSAYIDWFWGNLLFYFLNWSTSSSKSMTDEFLWW